VSDLREAIARAVYESDVHALIWEEALRATRTIYYANADAVLAVVTAHMTVTDEDTLQILRGYWRDVGASFGEMEIKHMVELLEAFVARKLKGEPK